MTNHTIEKYSKNLKDTNIYIQSPIVTNMSFTPKNDCQTKKKQYTKLKNVQLSSKLPPDPGNPTATAKRKYLCRFSWSVPTPLCWSPCSASATPFEREFCIKCKSPEQPSCPTSHPWHAPQPPWISVSLSWLDTAWRLVEFDMCAMLIVASWHVGASVDVCLPGSVPPSNAALPFGSGVSRTPSPKLKLEAILHLINATSVVSTALCSTVPLNVFVFDAGVSPSCWFNPLVSPDVVVAAASVCCRCSVWCPGSRLPWFCLLGQDWRKAWRTTP